MGNDSEGVWVIEVIWRAWVMEKRREEFWFLFLTLTWSFFTFFFPFSPSVI